jgi:hypothetical protein
MTTLHVSLPSHHATSHRSPYSPKPTPRITSLLSYNSMLSVFLFLNFVHMRGLFLTFKLVLVIHIALTGNSSFAPRVL